MDRPIQAGDLVEIIKPAMCGCCFSLGERFTVALLGEPRNGFSYCLSCGNNDYSGGIYAFYDTKKVNGIQIWRVKRIDPPAQPEEVTTDERITA